MAYSVAEVALELACRPQLQLGSLAAVRSYWSLYGHSRICRARSYRSPRTYIGLALAFVPALHFNCHLLLAPAATQLLSSPIAGALEFCLSPAPCSSFAAIAVALAYCMRLQLTGSRRTCSRSSLASRLQQWPSPHLLLALATTQASNSFAAVALAVACRLQV